MTGDSSPAGDAPAAVDTTVPQTARIWNYWLGGKDNYAVDRHVGDDINKAFPEIVELARASRAFLARATRHLARDLGVRQFLDIGTGLPTANNTHDVAQAVAPDSRIVYVDNDPLVLVYARALLTSTRAGATDYIDADLREPDTILLQAADTLDLTKPTALIMSGILAHLDSYEQAKSTVEYVMGRLSPGSFLLVSDSANTSRGVVEAARIWNQSANPQYHLRTVSQITGYFDGLELIEPGVVPSPRWRPEGEAPDVSSGVDNYGGVGRKP